MPDSPDKQPIPPTSYLRRYGVRTIWSHLALNFACVLLLTLAFPRPGWAVLAFFAPIPIGVLAMRTTRLWTLAWTTMLVFTGWWGLRVLWLSAVSPAAPWGVAVVMSLWMTAMVVALAQVQRRFRAPMTLVLPIFWVTQEWLRGSVPWGGFPWFTLGSSQAMWTPGGSLPMPGGYLVQTADLFGVLTVSFLVAMTAGYIVDLIAQPITKRNARGKPRPRRTVVFASLMWAGCFGGALVYGYRAGNDVNIDKGGGPRIAVVQTNVSQNNKVAGTAEQRARDWDTLFELSDAALADTVAPDLIVWPETMVVRPINDEYLRIVEGWIEIGGEAAAAGRLGDDPELERLYNASLAERVYRDRLDRYAQSHGVPLIVGGRAEYVADDERLMNSAFLIEPGAATYPRYSKQQLVPFGEYIPGGDWIKGLFMRYFSPYGPDKDYTLRPGERPVVFQIDLPRRSLSTRSRDIRIDDGAEDPAVTTAEQVDFRESPRTLRVATPICFEDVVGPLCRQMVYAPDGTKRVDVLVNLTNDGWFAGTHQGYQHLQLATLRCIENRVPMVRSVNTGVSGFIDSTGRVTEVVSVDGQSQEVAGYATAAVGLDARTTLYARVGEAGPIGTGMAAGLLWLGVWVPRRRERAGKA